MTEPNFVRNPKKREVLLHLSREKKLERKERISLRLKDGSARDDNTRRGMRSRLRLRHYR
jgi:hypothetical protein